AADVTLSLRPRLRLGRRLRRRHRRQLACHEPTRPVIAIAEGLVPRVPAPAQGDRFLARGDHELVAQMVDDLDGPLDDQGPVLAAANHDKLAHGVSPGNGTTHRTRDGFAAIVAIFARAYSTPSRERGSCWCASRG